MNNELPAGVMPPLPKGYTAHIGANPHFYGGQMHAYASEYAAGLEQKCADLQKQLDYWQQRHTTGA